MLKHVTIKFDVDPEEYGDDVNVHELVKAMLCGDADWPWECNEEPECTIDVR